jgi:predicted enzyme related to lactoylglutathione lyase
MNATHQIDAAQQSEQEPSAMTTTRTTMHITEIRTVAVPVGDQDRALEFYRDVLGLETRIDMPFGEDQRWLEVVPTAATTSIALVNAGETAPTGIDTGIRLTTDDAVADHATLRAAGIDVDAEMLQYPVPMFTLRDPDRNVLYVVQRQDG